MNDYENIVSTDFTDVKGVYDFLAKYIYPAIDPECVIYGNQNNITYKNQKYKNNLPIQKQFLIFHLFWYWCL